MKTSTKMAIVTVLLGLPAFALAQRIWPSPADAVQPTGILFGLFIFYSLIDALAFGFGVAFLLFGWPMVRKASANGKLALTRFLAATWLIGSWWPHDNLHRHINHDDLVSLIKLEYGFHLTLIICGLILGQFVWETLMMSKPVQQQG